MPADRGSKKKFKPYSEYLSIEDGPPDHPWSSPAISFKETLDGPILNYSNLELNKEYYVTVKIDNLGQRAAPHVWVKFYSRAPSVAEWDSYMPIGDPVVVESIQAFSSQTFISSQPWSPSEHGSSILRCILVNCYNLFDRIPQGNEFNYKEDRHVTQRNVSLLEAAPGESIQFRLKAGISKRKNKEVSKRYIVIRQDRVDSTLLSPLSQSKDRRRSLVPSKRPFESIMASMRHVEPGKNIQAIFKPGVIENVDITLTVPKDAEKGEAWVFTITQEKDKHPSKSSKIPNTDLEHIDGGYTILVSV
ncbi:MAG: hypothetical protein BroJett011_77670 [Chloroflexota bacterium]|nr:MAG: hypothetical protein BroJett011_77670 [Chloroflexota bacterium]